MAEKLVSVIMTNYNTPREYLEEAIDSIRNQTHKNIEFIIVDDCSTNDSLDYIKSIDDNRITIICNDVNLGITKSLNKALSACHGEYIARMDADDISLPQRIEKQVAFMEKNTDVIVCGTWVNLFGSGSACMKQKYSCKIIPRQEEFRVNLLFGNHTNIIHPTAMFRRKMLENNSIQYNEKYKYAQDYRMWVECSKFGECSNVEEILFNYRIHDKAVSSEKKTEQSECTKAIITEQLSWINLKLPDEWERIHFGFIVGRKDYDLKYYKWIKTIIKANSKKKIYNQRILKDLLWKKWAEICYFEISKNKKNFGVLFKLPLKYYPELLRLWKSRKGNQ